MNERPTKSLKRRDGAGHLDPAYAEKLREISEQSAPEKDGTGFVSEARSSDSLAEELGESFVRAATSGEDDETAVLDQVVAEELGGPFVPTTGADEYAEGTDESNPDGADREAFPKT